MKNTARLKLFFVLCVVAFTQNIPSAFAQEIEWQNMIGGWMEDYLYSIQQTTDGGYILAGASNSPISGDKTETSNGPDNDYWIVKTDSAGNIQWQNTINAIGPDELTFIQQTSDGGYILGGYSDSYLALDKTEWSQGLNDYWIVKTDSAGNIQWQNTIGGGSEDILYSIQQTFDGGYILGGYSYSGISGDKTENSNGGYDYWIVKTNSTGIIQWQNTIGGSYTDYLFSIQQTIDGGYILGGYSQSDISGDKTENSNGSFDYWIVKTDTSGNILWQNTIGGSGWDELHCIHQTTDGGYILGGYSNSNISGDKMENSIGLNDYWIIKTDGTGNIQWQNTIGGSLDDKLYSIQQTSDGGYILGGYSWSNTSGDKTENNLGQGDYWIVKTDSAGNIQWQNTIGGANSDWLKSMQQTSDDGYLLGGYSSSPISGDKTEENFNNCSDYWILKLTDKYNFITGKLFIDANSNAVQDSGEIPLVHKSVTEINTGRLAFSEQNGFYSVSVLDTGNFTVAPTAMNYFNTVPVTHSAIFTGSFQQTDSLNDFAFQPAGVFNDLHVSITPLNNFRSGFNASYQITFSNYGTTTLLGAIILFKNPNWSYVSANPNPIFTTVDSIVWTSGVLSPFQTKSIVVTVNVNTGLPIGTLINSNVRIEPIANDANSVNNFDTSNVYVTGAVDPNDILVSEDTLTTTQLSIAPYLDYIIRFQNTGNDTAFNVRVLNNISLNLDIGTFEFVASSHLLNISYGIHARLLTFDISNILLPDSNTNELASHGFIRYRIKPSNTLVAGDNISNAAFIYFDFNNPVATNTAVTHIVLPTGLTPNPSPKERGALQCYPNPTANELTVTGYVLSANEKTTLKVFDVFGKEIMSLPLGSPDGSGGGAFKLQTSNYPQGVYFVQVGSLRAKFVKQ